MIKKTSKSNKITQVFWLFTTVFFGQDASVLPFCNHQYKFLDQIELSNILENGLTVHILRTNCTLHLEINILLGSPVRIGGDTHVLSTVRFNGVLDDQFGD